MKKNIFFCSAIMLMSALSACNSESPEIPVSDKTGNVTFHLDFKGMNNAGTRAFSDGSTVNSMKCYVYNQADGDNAAPFDILNIPIDRTSGNPTGEISVSLPFGETFDFVFLAVNDGNSILTYNSAKRTLSVDYTNSGNQESMDCFFASAKDITVGNVYDNAITLTRPFAQVNIGTKDWDDYNSVSPISTVGLTIGNIYSEFSLMDGSLVGDAASVTFPASKPSIDQSFPKDGYKYISMNYVLVNLRTLINVSLTVNHSNGTDAKTINIGDVAVERNYQTNIYADKLLSEH